MGPNGVLYGVTTKSTGGYGTAFELDPPLAGSTHWTYTVIYAFTELNGSPSGALAFGPNQSLYGTTGVAGPYGGTVYSLTPPSDGGTTWTQTTLYIFPGGSRRQRSGGHPRARYQRHALRRDQAWRKGIYSRRRLRYGVLFDAASDARRTLDGEAALWV